MTRIVDEDEFLAFYEDIRCVWVRVRVGVGVG